MGPTQTPTPNTPTPGANPGATPSFTPGANTSGASPASPTPVQPHNMPPSFGGFVPPKPHGDIILEPEKPQKKSHLKLIIIVAITFIAAISGVAIWALVSSRNSNDVSHAPSRADTLSLVRADFANFTKQLIYDKPDSVDTPNYDIKIDDWQIKKVIDDYTMEDTIAYGDNLAKDWSSFLDAYQSYGLSENAEPESIKTLNSQITTQYSDLISALVDYLHFNDTTQQISTTYKQSGADTAKAIIAKIDEKKPDQQSVAGALHGFIVEALNTYYDYNTIAARCLETNTANACKEIQDTNSASDLAITGQRYSSIVNFMNDYIGEALKTLQTLSKKIEQTLSSANISTQQGASDE